MIRGSGGAKLIMLITISITRGAAAADWSNTLDAVALAGYVTNPQLIAGSNVADEFAQLTGDGNSTVQTERSQLSLTPRFSLTRYSRESDLNINSGSVDLAFQEKLERGQWTIEGLALTDSTVTSELGLTGITNVNRRHYLSSVSSGYQYEWTERLSWSLQASWQSTRYTDAELYGLTDYGYASIALGPSWALNERITGSVNFEADRLDPKGGARQDSYSASAQLKRRLTEQYSWRLSAGQTRVDVDGAGSKSSAIWDIGASRQGEQVQWDLDLRRSVIPIGLGLLARADTGTLSLTAGTSEKSAVTLSFSLIRSNPVYYLTYVAYHGATWGQLNAEWKYHFSPRWGITAAYVQSRARNGDSDDWANGTQARLSVFWQSSRL